jgi:polygalacturonase
MDALVTNRNPEGTVSTIHCRTAIATIVQILCAGALACSSALAAAPFDVRAFGAKGDGAAKDTQAIQAAIDKASAQGGGTVVIPPGNYLSGTLHLRSNLTVRIEKGARLAFSPDDADFDAYEALPYQIPASAASRDMGDKRPLPPDATPAQRRRYDAPPAYDDTETSYAHYALFSGDGVRNVTLEGDGEIDGNRPKRGGPKPVCFKNSQWISIRDLTLRNAPNYNISLIGSDHVDVDGVRILNGYADGIDPDNCHFVRITNSYIDSWDDAVCPKASFALGKRRGTEHLVVANCILRTASNAFKFGTESEGDLKNVSVTNCVVLHREEEGRRPVSGIAIESVDGANIDGVVISNISIEDALAAIFIRLGGRGRSMAKAAPGSLRNVLIRNVTATNASLASSITGVENGRVENVTIAGLALTMNGGGALRGLDVPEVPTKYPDATMFGELPALGLYTRHVDGLTLRDIKVHAVQPDARPAMIFDDVAGLELSGFDSSAVPAQQPLVLFRNVAGALLYGNRLSAPAETFLAVQGEKSADIVLEANDLRRARNPVRTSPEVPGGAVSESNRRR